MAYSIQREASDGTLVLLDISINYIDRDEISVLFDGVVQVEGDTWDWVGTIDAKLSFTPAVGNGVEVAVVRQTDLSDLRHRFSEGAAFTANSMDEALEQVLHIAQEAAEQLQGTDFYNDLNMHGYLIKNIGDGADPGDAANVGQMTAHDATIVGYRDQTLVYRNEAEGFADDAEASATVASTAADIAVATHVALPDPHTQYLGNADIGVSVQAYDADTAKTNVAQTFTQPQRPKIYVVDHDGSFDLAAGQNFYCQPSGAIQLAFTTSSGYSEGQSGYILFHNTSNYTITRAARIGCSASMLSKISVTGLYLLSYVVFSEYVYLTASEAVIQ